MVAMNGDVKRLSRLEQVRALSDPTRLQLLELFKERRMTTMQAAAAMGVPPTRLYHHVKRLESLGFIKLVEERRTRGTIEKYFEAVARAFSVDPTLFEGGSPRAQAARSLAANMLTTVLDRARAEAADSLAAGLIGRSGAEPPIIIHSHLKTGPKGLAKVKTRIKRCVDDIQKIRADGQGRELQTYTLVMGCFQIRRGEGPR
jgi:DNA-binding transcriptional ArsR family regulator